MRISAVLIAGMLVPFCLTAQVQKPESKEAQSSETKGMPPRANVSDYPAHAQAGAVTIGAEFMGHSVPRPEGSLSTDDYVVVETGLFGSPGERIKLSIDDFSLRINGKKAALSSQPYGLVAGSLKDPAWAPPTPAGSSKPKTSFGSGGQGDSNGPPPPVHVPIELQRAMAQDIQKASLPEGDRPLPQAGLIFFQYRGKTKSIRSLELIYAGAAGKATLPLQP